MAATRKSNHGARHMVAVLFDQRVMCEDEMKVLVTGKQDRRVMLALALLGADIVTADTFEVKPLEITGVWRGECIALAPERQSGYGPVRKGRGGKVRRW